MAVTETKLGKGVLTIGDVGAPQAFASQVTEVVLSASVDKGDPVEVLSGDTLPGDRTETFKLAGELIQDYGSGAASVSEWLLTNRGKRYPFEFLPYLDSAKKLTGTLEVEFADIGGPVGKRATSKFSFDLVGEPVSQAVGP